MEYANLANVANVANINILIYPVNSGVGMEVCDQLNGLDSIKLYGVDVQSHPTSDVPMVYIGGCPRIDVDDTSAIKFIRSLCTKYNIKLIIPAMDCVISPIQDNLPNVRIFSSPPEAVRVCNNKLTTYTLFKHNGVVKVPIVNPVSYPKYIKPVDGYGGRDHLVVYSSHPRESDEKYICTEVLDGDEYTVDCHSTAGQLTFAITRRRISTRLGLAVASSTDDVSTGFAAQMHTWAEEICNVLSMENIWFFQVKIRQTYQIPVLLEIGARIPGAFATSRPYLQSSILHLGSGRAMAKLNPILSSTCIKVYRNQYDIKLPSSLKTILIKYPTSEDVLEQYIGDIYCISHLCSRRGVQYAVVESTIHPVEIQLNCGKQLIFQYNQLDLIRRLVMNCPKIETT